MLLASAHIEAVFRGPPTAEEIRAKDQIRLLEDPILAEPAAEEDLALASKVLETMTPEVIAAALIRLYRKGLPSPEDLYDDPRDNGQRTVGAKGGDRAEKGEKWRPERDDRDGGPVGRPERMAPEDVTWFRVTVGRANNADPKWLIPLICRLGHVTKKEIGSIRIFDRETKFEIANIAADKFTNSVKATEADEIKIEPSTPPGGRPEGGGGGPRKSFDGKPPFKRGEGKPPFNKGEGKPYSKPDGDRPKPWAGKDRPAGEKSYGDKPAYGDKPSFGDKPFKAKPYGDKPGGGGGGKPFKGKSNDAPRPPRGEGKPFKPAGGGKPFKGPKRDKG